MKEDCLSEEATDQAKSQLEPSLDKSKNSVEIKDSTQFNALQAGTSAGQLPVSQINATVVLKEKAGTVESARTCFQGVMDGLFNSLGNGSNGKNGLNSNAVSDPLCIESVQIADLKVQSLVEKPSGVGEGEKGMDPDTFRVLEGVKGVLSFAFGEASLVPSGLIQSEVLIGDFSLFDKKEETNAELLNEEKRTGEVQLLEEKVVLLNSCDEIEKMDIDNGTGDVQFKEEKLISVKSSEELGQMDIDNETGDVQLKKEKTVLVNSSDETNQMDIDNGTGEVQLKEENLVLVNSSDETNLMDTDNGTGEVQCKDEEQVIVKTSERTEQTETENKTGEVQFKEEKPVLVEVPEERNPSVEKREKQRNPKHDPLFVFTRRNPKRSASSSQTDLNIDRLTRISNRGRKSKKEREIEAADPKLMSSIAPNPNLATKKRNLFNRREKPSVWGRINNVEQVLQQSREFYNLKEFRDQSEKRNRALERERKEKERIAKQTVINSEAVNLERDLDSTLTHEVSNQEATQKAANGADSLEPGSSPDSVVYNPANPVAGQDGSGIIKIKEEQKSDVVLINGAANPVAGRNGSVVKSKEEKKGKGVLPNGAANHVAGQNGSVVKNREEKKGKGVLPNGAANHVAGRSGSVVKNREERKSKELDEPWFYKGKKKEEKNDNADYNGVTIAYSPWMSMHNFPPPMSVLPLRSVPMVMTAKPLRSVPMPAKKPSDVPLPNPSPAPAFLAPTPPSRVRPPAYPGPAPAFLAPTPPNRLRPPANPGPAVAPASRVPDVPAYRVPAVPGYTGPAVQFYVVPGAQAKANPVPALAKKRLAWVCCDDCGKWRCIPAELADEIGETDATWTCKENQDKRFSDCSVPQEKSNAEINAELELSDGSGDEGPAGQRPKFQETNITNPFMHGMQQFYPSSGQKPLHPAYFVPLKTNLFLHRSPKTQTIDEIMVCNCKLPKNGGMGCRSQCLNRLLSIECVKGMCPCGDLCSNQQFQRRDYSKLMWFRSGKKGFGLQSQEDVPAGRFLIEYVGEVLDMPTYEARQREYAARGQKHFYFMTLNGGEVIDAFAKGNLGRFINHSCDPNCRTEKWIVNGEVCIGLFAIRDIKQGEELTFDYNYVRVFGAAAKKCFCGSKICRGYLGGDPSSTELVVQADSDEEEDYIHQPVLPPQPVMPFQPFMPPQPVMNQSVMIKPVMPQPVVSQPVVVKPVMIKPVGVKPVVIKPPVMIKPVVSQPVGVKPVVIKPPVMIKPVVSQPVGVKPVVIKPPVVSQHVMSKLDPNPQPVINYQAERISSLQKYIVSEDREDLTGSKLKRDKAVIQQVKPIRDYKSENREEVNGFQPVSVGNGKSENREEVNGLKPVSVGNGSVSVESEEASRRLGGEVDKKKDLNQPFSSSSAGLPPYDFLSFERIGNAQSENCTASKEEERMDRIKSSSILLATTQSKNLSVNREDDRMDRDDSSILLATSQSKNLSVNREDDRMDRDDPSILLATSQSENRSVSRETEGTKRVNSPVLLNTSQSENCAVNTEDVSIPVLDLNCSENSEDISVPNLPETPVKSEEGKEEEIEKTPVRVTRSSKRLNGTNIDKTDITPGSNKTDVKPGSDKKASDDSKPKRARLVRNSEKLSNQMNEMKKREVRRDLFHEEKNVSRNTDDDDFFEGVEERLNKLLDADGGISRRKDATMGYLKLLIVTAAAGDTGTTQRLRDLSLILDALLKTKSRTVLTDIMSKNGLHMLHTILKQNRDNFNRIPILRKLLKVLDFLAEKEILTLEQMNRGPPCPGAESFRDSIYKLIKHQNNLVHRAAREFFNKWMPKNMRVKEPSFINPLKRKDRWDPPSQNPNFPSPNPNFISQNPNFTKRYNPVPSPAKKLCTQNPNSQNDDAPPGFGPSGKTVIIEPSPPVQLPAGERQERYRAGTSVSYGIPAGTAQSLSTFIQSQVGVIWGIAPSIPFKPFPPLPQNPRVLEESEKRREKESYVNREYKDDRRRRRYEPYSSNSNLKSSNSNSNSNSNLDLESGSSRRPRVSRWDKDEKYERKNKYDNYDNDGDKKGVSRASSWPKWPREER